MKKYYKLFILPAIVIIIAGIFSGFSDQSQEQLIRDILEERTMLMQKTYAGKIEREKAEINLGKIETYPLLTEDIQSIRNFDATDMDIVKSIEIINISQTTKMFDYVSYDVAIRWYMDGYDGSYIYDHEYSVVLKAINNELRLSEFNSK